MGLIVGLGVGGVILLVMALVIVLVLVNRDTTVGLNEEVEVDGLAFTVTGVRESPGDPEATELRDLMQHDVLTSAHPEEVVIVDLTVRNIDSVQRQWDPDAELGLYDEGEDLTTETTVQESLEARGEYEAAEEVPGEASGVELAPGESASVSQAFSHTVSYMHPGQVRITNGPGEPAWVSRSA